MATFRALAVILMVLFFCQFAAMKVGAAVNVAIIPFEGDPDQGAKFLKEGIARILASRLGIPNKIQVIEKTRVDEAVRTVGPLSAAGAMESVGYKLDADYLISGTVTRTENGGVEVATRLINVREHNLTPQTFSTTSNGLNEVIERVSALAERMRRTIIVPAEEGAPAPSDTAGKEAEPIREERIEPGERAGVVPPPKIALGSEPVDSEAESPLAIPEEPEVQGGKASLNYWRSESLPHFVQGMAVGDVDGDKENEVVLVTEDTVFIYRKGKKKLSRVAEYEEKNSARLLKVDVADINGNGRAEIFVTALKDNAVSSFVVELSTDTLTKTAKDLNLFLGVVDIPGEGQVLLGQRYGTDDPLKGEVLRMKWEWGAYVTLPSESLPKGVNVFGLGVLGNGGSGGREYIALQGDGHLDVYSQDGTLKWQSRKVFGGSDNSFVVPADQSEKSEEKTVSLPLRLVVNRLKTETTTDIIVGNNFTEKEGMENPMVVSDNGFLADLQWDGNETTTLWRTGKLDEYVADYAVADADNDGRQELVVAVRSGRSYLTFRPKAYILMYEII